jgi:PAS domain S-box-containing protein
MMQSASAASYASTLRWAHVPLALVVLSIIWFVHFHFGTGRLWLAWAASGLRLLGLALNFVTGANINFQDVRSLDRLGLWGDAVVVGPVGSANPWAFVPQVGNLLLFVFVVDASVALWRRGGADARRRAAVVGGGVLACIAAVAGFGALITLGVVHAPTIVMPGVFLIVLAMGCELGWDLIAAARLAQRLRASETRLREVVESVPSAILLVDRQGLIALANAQAETLFGYPRAQLLAMPVDRLVPDRSRSLHAGLRAAYADRPRTRAMGGGRELFARRRDGSELAVEIALSPMDTSEGPYVLVAVSDISARKALERASARQRDELAHLSRVAMLGELSGSLAHELNQPLTAILSNAQAAQRFLAQRPPRVDQIDEILADIVKSDHRARAVIQRLRAMLRKEDAQHEALDLNDLVEESLRLLRSDLLNRGVTLGTELAPGLPAVSGDRVQLQQVLLNLLMNACDAMEAQAADRRLQVVTRAAAPGQVRIEVIDCGTGIAADELERIFEPFVTTKAKGIGLGLAICRSIVGAHGGRLWASNNALRGATLHCELPTVPD